MGTFRMPALDEALEQTLRSHGEWLARGEAGGTRADLGGRGLREADLGDRDLRRANLAGADLSRARLVGANLSEADLTGADLTDADLCRANLAGARLDGATLGAADLQRANLRNASLLDVDLRETRRLTEAQLGGSDLFNARVPASIAGFEGLVGLAELSRSMQALLLTMVSATIYIGLTIASTTDLQLLNRATPVSTRLPILGLDIPYFLFYWVAPVFLICLYLYFHSSLQAVWSRLGDLPAVFPDGTPLDRKAYPWLLNEFVRRYTTRLLNDPSPLWRVQVALNRVVLWYAVPAMILLFWARTLCAHDVGLTTAYLTLLLVAMLAGSWFHRLAFETLGRSTLEAPRPSARRFVRLAAACSAVAVIMLFFSTDSFRGINFDCRYDAYYMDDYEDVDRKILPVYNRNLVNHSISLLNYHLVNRLGVNTFANLQELDVSTRPPNWIGRDANLETIRLVKGADLHGQDMRFARAREAFLVNADLEGSDLREADLQRADLRGVDLTKAVLDFANLGGADMEFVRLKGARLEGAILRRANLDNGNLTPFDPNDELRPRADVVAGKGADRKAAAEAGQYLRTRLRGADLRMATLVGANLRWADLTSYRAVGIPRPVRTRLSGADLSKAVLIQADLTGADLSPYDPNSKVGLVVDELVATRLRGADLRLARLVGADLSRADLRAFHPPLPKATGTPAPAGESPRPTESTPPPSASASASSAPPPSQEASESEKASRPIPTHLEGADLSGVILRDATLAGAVFDAKTKLTGADLRGADLSEVVGLTQAQVREVIDDARTRYPRDITSPKRVEALGRR